MDVTVRTAVAADAAAVTDLFLESARYHATDVDPSVHAVPDEVDARLTIDRAIADGSLTAVLIATSNAAVVGYAIVMEEAPIMRGGTWLPVRYAFVDELAVAEAVRGQGGGTTLLRAAEAWARERGAEAMLLITHPDNERALAFYRSHMGYRDVGVRLMRRLD